MNGGGGHPPFFANAQVMAIDPADIFVPERIGFLHEDKAVALGRLMAVDGQRDPIKVVARKGFPQWRLVTGRHRLRGAELEGLPVYALEVLGKAEELTDLEASENLHRRPLPPIERAAFVHALCQAAQERIAREHGGLSQHKLAVKARWDRVKHGEINADQALREESEDTADKMSAVYGWVESAADALDLDKRTIRRSLELHRLLIEPFPDLIEALSKHPVVGENASQLKMIAAVQDEAKRREVIEALLADPEIGSEDAIITAGLVDGGPKGPSTPEEKLLSRATATLHRMSDSEREAFVEHQALLQRVPVMRRIHERLGRELGFGDELPRKVGVAQAADTLSIAIDIVNRLIDGGGVDDEELDQLRKRAQAVVFDMPEEPSA